MKKSSTQVIIIMLISYLLLLTTNVFPQNNSWKGKIKIKDGVKYIYNPKEGLWDNDPTKKLTIKRMFSLGSVEADEEYLFSWVQYITTDSLGNIYVCDSKENRIQVYNKDGKYLKTIGQKGQGPGELMRPMKVLIGRNGNIYINDDLNYRISIFNSKGKFINSFRIEGF